MPSIHKRYIESMVGMFGDSAEHCIDSMRPAATGGLTVDMENYYSRLALDIIGKARPPLPHAVLPSRPAPVCPPVLSVISLDCIACETSCEYVLLAAVGADVTGDCHYHFCTLPGVAAVRWRGIDVRRCVLKEMKLSACI